MPAYPLALDSSADGTLTWAGSGDAACAGRGASRRALDAMRSWSSFWLRRHWRRKELAVECWVLAEDRLDWLCESSSHTLLAATRMSGSSRTRRSISVRGGPWRRCRQERSVSSLLIAICGWVGTAAAADDDDAADAASAEDDDSSTVGAGAAAVGMSLYGTEMATDMTGKTEEGDSDWFT